VVHAGETGAPLWLRVSPKSSVDGRLLCPTPVFRGAITARKTGVGQYRVVFGGLARPAGATETVQISPFLGSGEHFCAITSWGTTGANDLTVTLACFDPTGTPADAQFNLLVVQ
jgi:hypothetical protein